MIKTLNRKFLVADFETSTEKWYEKEGVARVWLWGLYDIDEDKFEYGLDIKSFMAKTLVNRSPNPIIYFHNLKFDGSYIVSWLYNNGYTFDTELSKENTFKTCISDMGLWYFIEVCISVHKKQKVIIRFQDSLKKIPLPVRDIPKAFGFNDILNKGELDYDTIRPVGHMPTQEELSYLIPDCKIVAMALKQLENEGFTKMTGSSDAFYQWKLTLLSDSAKSRHISPDVQYRRLFPILPIEVDDFIRKAYRGGWTYVNPRFAGKILNKPVEVWDINSMYPSKMKNKYLPIGEPTHFIGEPKPTKYQCYIVRIMVSFDIKEGFLPTIQVKNSYFFNPTDYITSSEGQEIELYMTNMDLRLMFRHYNINSIKYIEGYYFRKYKGLFDKHVDTNMAIKEQATGGKRYIAKLRMNSVYGKTATSPRRQEKIPYLDEDGVIRFIMSEEEIGEPQATAEGVFITSWARFDIINDAQNNVDKFIYCDTDSLHMFANEDGTPPNLPIHQTHLGYYKKEHDVVKSIFLRSKTYVEEYPNGDVEIKCAGASPEIKKNMSFDNFKMGSSFDGKLMPCQVKGGVILCNTCFTIK